MIQLKNDCLIIQTDDGQQIPCSAESVIFELMGEGSQLVDPEVVRHASAVELVSEDPMAMRRRSASVSDGSLISRGRFIIDPTDAGTS